MIQSQRTCTDIMDYGTVGFSHPHLVQGDGTTTTTTKKVVSEYAKPIRHGLGCEMGHANPKFRILAGGWKGLMPPWRQGPLARPSAMSHSWLHRFRFSCSLAPLQAFLVCQEDMADEESWATVPCYQRISNMKSPRYRMWKAFIASHVRTGKFICIYDVLIHDI